MLLSFQIVSCWQIGKQVHTFLCWLNQPDIFSLSILLWCMKGQWVKYSFGHHLFHFDIVASKIRSVWSFRVLLLCNKQNDENSLVSYLVEIFAINLMIQNFATISFSYMLMLLFLLFIHVSNMLFAMFTQSGWSVPQAKVNINVRSLLFKKYNLNETIF